MAVEALCIAEYKGMKFNDGGQRFRLTDLPKMGGLAMVKNGDQVLDALGLNEKTYRGVMNNLAAMSVFNLFISWIGLSFFGTGFTQASGKPSVDEKEKASNDDIGQKASERDGVKVPLVKWF